MSCAGAGGAVAGICHKSVAIKLSTLAPHGGSCSAAAGAAAGAADAAAGAADASDASDAGHADSEGLYSCIAASEGGTETLLMVLVLPGNSHNLNASALGVSTRMPDASDVSDAAGASGQVGGGQGTGIACIDT